MWVRLLLLATAAPSNRCPSLHRLRDLAVTLLADVLAVVLLSEDGTTETAVTAGARYEVDEVALLSSTKPLTSACHELR